MLAPAHAVPRRERGFTLLELGLTLALIGLLVTLVLPRLGVLGGVSLQASARRLASRIELLREDAALRSRWVRLSFDPRTGRYGADVLVATTSGARFVAEDTPLFRAVTLPESIELEVAGPGVTTTTEGALAALFAPDGFTDPMVVRLKSKGHQALSVVVEPTRPKPRIVDGEAQVRVEGF